MTPGADAGTPGVARLGKAMTSRLRRACAGRAVANAVLATSLAVILLEIAARVTHVQARMALEGAAGIVALVVGAVRYFVMRPAPALWRSAADRMAAEPGIFSALGDDVRPTALSEVVHARAEAAALDLLSRSTPARGLPVRARQAILATAVAAIAALLPGIRRPEGALDAGVQGRLLAHVREMDADAPPADRELLAKTAAALEDGRLTAGDARALAEKLGHTADERAARSRLLADSLARKTLLRNLAEALRKDDPAALERAIRDLVDRVRKLQPRSAEALEAAALLLELASAEKDEALKKALADAGRTLAGGDGAGEAEALRALGPPLQRLMRSTEALRDVVVTLESAATPPGAGDGETVRGAARRPENPSAPPRESAGGLPLPGDFRSRARSGTSDELVLRRYFALP